MKQKNIPLEKRSKREQREYHAAQRGSWGCINPVTRRPPNPKAYNRKKSGQRYEHEPLPGFLFSPVCQELQLLKERDAKLSAASIIGGKTPVPLSLSSIHLIFPAFR